MPTLYTICKYTKFVINKTEFERRRTDKSVTEIDKLKMIIVDVIYRRGF